MFLFLFLFVLSFAWRVAFCVVVRVVLMCCLFSSVVFLVCLYIVFVSSFLSFVFAKTRPRHDERQQLIQDKVMTSAKFISERQTK